MRASLDQQTIRRFLENGSAFALVLYLGSSVAGGQSASPSPTLAELDGEPITAQDVSRAGGAALAQLEERIYTVKRAALDTAIAERLLAREAARRRITISTLVDREITTKVAVVSEHEIDTFCSQHSEQCRVNVSADVATKRAQIRVRLQQQKLALRRAEFIETLRDKASIKILISPPPFDRVDVTLGSLPARGADKAPVTIVEFSDFHCPFCRSVEPTLQRLLAKYPSQVRLIYRDAPVDSLHPEAGKAAEAARCANDQGKFWDFHDQIYAGPIDAGAATLRKFAEVTGMDLQRFEDCVMKQSHKAAVRADVAYASSLGITGTPTFFINGRMVTGSKPFDAFVQIVEDELAVAKNSSTTASR